MTITCKARPVEEFEVLNVELVQSSNVLAFVDLRVGGVLIVTRCAVIQGKRGVFATLPRMLNREGKWADVVTVLDDQLLNSFKRAIVEAYNQKVQNEKN